MNKCEFVLNNTNKCICETAYHNSWSFGERGEFCEEDNLYFDDEISGMVEEMLSSIVSGRPPPSLGPRQLSNRFR